MLTADPSLLTANHPLSPMGRSGTVLERSGKPSGRTAARPVFRKWLKKLELSILPHFCPLRGDQGRLPGDCGRHNGGIGAVGNTPHLHALALFSYHATNTEDLPMSSKEELGFQKAKERIETCLQNNWGGSQLDLSGCFLTSSALKSLLQLPIAKTSLAKIQYLNISNNQITELPPEIAELSTLNSIQMSHNKLDTIPGPIKALINLGSIAAEHNRITEITDDIASLVNLISLELNDNQISYISDKISNLKGLATLKLSNNKISKLPEDIGELKQLTYLDLFSNQLSRLPLSLRNHESLRFLILHNNEELDIPANILGPTLEESKYGKNTLAIAKTILNYYFNRYYQETPVTTPDMDKINPDAAPAAAAEEEEEEEEEEDDDVPPKPPTDHSNSSNNSHKTDDQPVRDQATEDNEMGPSWDAMVNGVESFLRNAKPPFVLSIEGSWGTGKSSMMLQLRRKLAQKKGGDAAGGKHGESDQFRTIWFNPWRYETGKDACVGLLFELISQAYPRKCWLRIQSYWKYLSRKHGFWPACVPIFFIAASIAAILCNPQTFSHALVVLTYFFSVLYAILALIRNPMTSLPGNLKHFLTNSKYLDSVEGPMELHGDFHRWLNVLLDKDQKLVVMMDDLDRCAGARPVEVLDALQQLLGPPGYPPSGGQVDYPVIVVMGIDRERVAASVATRYEDALKYHRQCPVDKSTDARSGIQFGYEYLQKFIHLPFHLPRPTMKSLDRYLVKMAPEAFEAMRSPPETVNTEGNDGESIPPDTATGGSNPPPDTTPKPDMIQAVESETKAELETSFVAKALLFAAEFLGKNPRLAKHFLNLLRIRWYIIRQIFQNEKPNQGIEDVARLALLEVARPDIFRQVTEDEAKRKLLAEWIARGGSGDTDKLKNELGESNMDWLNQSGKRILCEPWKAEGTVFSTPQASQEIWEALLADEV